MKQLDVQIMGQGYLLGCPEGGESRLLEAVDRVNSAMCQIRDAGKVRARDRIAVLAALNLAFELADRSAGAPPVPHAAAPLAPTAPASTAPQATGADAALDPRWNQLLAKLDDCLKSDGQLL